MPWSFPDNVPAVAQNWTEAQQRRCVEAANATLERTGDDEQAIYACITAAGKESEMERKVFKGTLELKADGEPGQFKAVFATLNVVDLDGDVTLPGAFTDGQPVRISSWAHGWDKLPVGRGEIHEADGTALVDGRFFLNTQTGKEHYETVKALGDLQEWSYGFDIIEAEPGQFDGKDVRFLKKLKVYEVSPVMLGAGIGTQTTAIKSEKQYNWQEIHDMAVQLGAKCAGHHEHEPEGDDKGQAQQGALSKASRETFAARIAIELTEMGFGPEGDSNE